MIEEYADSISPSEWCASPALLLHWCKYPNSRNRMSVNKAKSKYSPYPKDKPCPCGSGLGYGECCAKKSFKFVMDRRGNVRRRVKIHPRLKPVIEDAEAEFRKIFGRSPAAGDRIVFAQHLHSEDDFWQQARTVGRVAGVRDELIFAWRRTGFIVGEHSRKLMSELDYDEWQAAIDEFFSIKESGFDPFYVFTYLSREEYETYKRLVDKLDNTIIALGSALTAKRKPRDSASYFRYLLVARAIRSLRTIREMYNTRYDDDCLSIARAIYEAYLRMKLLRLDPATSERFEAMLAHEAGAYPAKLKKDGSPNYDVCVDPKTGKEYKIAISNREIIEISDFDLDKPLYYEMYPLLSGFVHPDLVQDAIKSTLARKLDLPRQGDAVLAIVLVLTICALLLMESALSTFLTQRTKRDLRYVAKSLSKDLQNLISCDSLLERRSVPISIYNLLGLEVQIVARESNRG